MGRFRVSGFVTAAAFTAGAAALSGLAATLPVWPERFGGLAEPALADVTAPSLAHPLRILARAGARLTGAPLDLAALQGKVIVVNFWTFSCINSLRALPYLKAWSDRYGADGLVVIGVNTPEFDFEHDAGNLLHAVDDLGIRYDVVQDNDFAIWKAFGNEGWPGTFIIDRFGILRDYQLGEGHYAEQEQLIRTLLGADGRPPAEVAAAGIGAQADWADLHSPETYLGRDKARRFRSPGGLSAEPAHRFAAAATLAADQWDLAGIWTVGPQYATPDAAGGRISYRFHARDLNMVLGAAAGGRPVRFRVTVDGAAPGTEHGVDVDAQGWGEVTEDRLYQLIRQRDGVADHTVTVEFEQPGIRAYSITFG